MIYNILHILCEGQTEERFVKEVLSPYLQQFNIYPKPILLLTSKKKNARGGMLSYAQAKRDLTILQKQYRDNNSEHNDLFYIDVEGQLYKANKSKTSYDVASIYLNYLDNIDESFEGRDWMVTSAKVGGTISSPHIAPISRNRILVRDIVTEDELSYMKTVSQDNDSYSYFLILRNSSKESVQLLPITFTFKNHL